MALDFVAGCLGGCAGILVGHPLDTIKVHLQTQDQRKPAYRGALHCFTDIVQRESVWSLYRGMCAPLAGVAAVNAVTFGVYGAARRLLGAADSLGDQFVAGALSGLAQSAICAPLEQLKTRGQLLGVGPLQCAADVLRRDGPRGLFRGLGATVLRDTPAMGVYFATYEAMTRGAAPAPTWLVLVAGGTAGAASWVFTYPVDVLKSRLQADGADGSPRRYSGMADCLRQSLRTDGWPLLTRGLGLVVVRAFPTNAACFFTVTLVLRWDQQRRQAPAAPLPPPTPPPGLGDAAALQLQAAPLRASWLSELVGGALAWRRSLAAAVSDRVFPPLDDRAAACERARPQPWSPPHYESAHRLFLHTTDFTEVSWLGSAEFLCPAEGDGKRPSLWKQDTRSSPSSEPSDRLASPRVESSITESCTCDTSSDRDMIADTSPVDFTPKCGTDHDVQQIIGSPASGLVRKPDAVRHISQPGTASTERNQDAGAKAELFEGYILPAADLWLGEATNESSQIVAVRR